MTGRPYNRHHLTFPYAQQSARWHVEEAAEALRQGQSKNVRPDTAREHLEMALRAFDATREAKS